MKHLPIFLDPEQILPSSEGQKQTGIKGFLRNHKRGQILPSSEGQVQDFFVPREGPSMSLTILSLSTISHYYLHIPFCRQKCPYCKFALTPIFDEFKKKRYIEYLKKEIKDSRFKIQDSKFKIQEPEKNKYISQGQKTKTIYFGGGTPSILSIDEVRDILDCFPERNSDCEITFECNPEDITTEYVIGLLDLGINRISLGVQSLNNDTLSAIHRSSESIIFAAMDAIFHSISQTGKIGISVNVDFILGLPHMKKGETLRNIKQLHREFPCITHTSVYILEKGSYPKDWSKFTLMDDLIQEEFGMIIEYFECIGWNHYELSNFSKHGFESKHNQAYWDHSHYRGFGLSAASYVGGKRWMNSESFVGYYRGDIVGSEVLTREQIAIEQLMFGLRTSGGFSLDTPHIVLNSHKIQEFVVLGFLAQSKNNIKLTKTGIFLIDYILSELISPP